MSAGLAIQPFFASQRDLLKEAVYLFRQHVNVRREDDDSEATFTTQEVQDGQLSNFVSRMDFAGNDYVQIPNSTHWHPDQYFVIEFDVYFDSLGDVQPLICKDINSDTGDFAIYTTNSGKLRWHIYGLSSIDRIGIITDNIAFSLNTLHHVKVIADGSGEATGMYIFVDDVQLPTSDDSRETFTYQYHAAPIHVGKRNIWATKYLDGYIANLSVYRDISGPTPTLRHQLIGAGGQDANWVDQIGDADGSVIGAPDARGKGFVKEWFNENDASEKASQSTAGSQPMIVVNGVLADGPQGDGSRSLTHALSGFTTGDDISVFLRFNATSTDKTILALDDALIIGIGAGGGLYFYPADAEYGSNLADGNDHTISLFLDTVAETGTLYVDDVLVSSTIPYTPVALSTITTLSLLANDDGSNGLTGEILSLALFNSDRIESRASIEALL
ncbi:LamG-like jellyroll fold domain-containing protein [Cerasicoccus frondis]|uniref:LamG-like jellyroll fold domain-containing protein n=1 Tax=Cerasicoccus frondis TaxID=490090 RepID=UPI002852D47A|nr:LamG-like jellyroll fold domain-containing protein [Cerasicoccus frondis]